MHVTQGESILAQVDSPTCTTTAARNKRQLPDFYSLVADNQKYTDSDFSADDSSFFWSNHGEGYWQGLANNYNSMEWKRAKDTFEGENNHLWGANGISPNDIRQGAIGNCWFMAAVSAYAEVPGRVEKMFLNQDQALN